MRVFRLARVAAQAELLRLRRLARRQAMRAALAGVALLFLLACLAALHLAGYLALRGAAVAPVHAALIVAAADLLLGALFAALAARDVPDAVEREAAQLRETAQRQVMEVAAMTAVAGPILRTLGVRKLYGLALAVLTALYLGRPRR